MLARQRLHTASFASQQPLSRPAVLVQRPASRQHSLQVCNSAVAQTASVPLKDATGGDKGEQKLALKVAEETAKGLVHRYLVMVLQNKRRVSVCRARQARARVDYCRAGGKV